MENNSMMESRRNFDGDREARRDENGFWWHCDEVMDEWSHSGDRVTMACGAKGCKYREIFQEDADGDPILEGDNVPSDPFRHDTAYLSLNPYQRYKLNEIWYRDGFGEPYRRGSWSKCGLYEQIKDWYRAEDKGFGISGNVGVGKTTTCGLIMACLAARNEFSFSYANAAELFDFLHRYHGPYKKPTPSRHAPTQEELDDARYKRLVESRYLFLDDVGTEYSADWNLNRFTQLVERRYGNKRLFIITSNLSMTALRERENWERIISRVAQYMTNWYRQGGEDKRVVKPKAVTPDTE